MNQRFVNKVALVTGGASGIGREICGAFSQAGARVVISDIDQALGSETARWISQASGEAMFVPADVTKPDQVTALVHSAVDAYGQIDYAINNAGVGGSRIRTAEYPDDEWHWVIDINLNGVYYCMKAEISQMLSQGHGVIVNMASVAGLVGFPSHAAYSASKHAVIGLTKTAALEYVRKGIRINAVCPGFTDTPMVQRISDVDPEYARQLIQGIPARRLGRPEEVADGVLYLCSDQASFAIGHALVLDGGGVAG